jgi:hypothetical protein
MNRFPAISTDRLRKWDRHQTSMLWSQSHFRLRKWDWHQTSMLWSQSHFRLQLWDRHQTSMFRSQSHFRHLALFVTLAALAACFQTSAFAQTALQVTVPASNENLCLTVQTDGIALAQTGVLVDSESPERMVPVQWAPAIAKDGTPAKHQLLLTAIPPGGRADRSRQFHWKLADEPAVEPPLRWVDESEVSIKALQGDSPVLVYNHGPIVCERLPENDDRRTRSCYVHPVWGLNGEILTDDFSADHVHHHGVFWTWPHVEIEGQHYDLWVPKGIRQRFIKWLYREAGPVAAVVGVENGWFVGDRQVMTERIWIRAFRAIGNRAGDRSGTGVHSHRSARQAGGQSRQELRRLDGPVRRLAAARRDCPGAGSHRSARGQRLGIVRRPVEHTSALGESEFSLSRSTAPVCWVGVHPPDHPDFPPTWLTRCYGPLCVGWPGVEGREFQPGESFTLRYRLLLHKTEVEHQQLEQAYSAYCQSQGIRPNERPHIMVTGNDISSTEDHAGASPIRDHRGVEADGQGCPSYEERGHREAAPGFGAALAVLRRGKAGPFLGRHPWVYESAIDRLEGEAGEGDVVTLVSDKRKFIARGCSIRTAVCASGSTRGIPLSRWMNVSGARGWSRRSDFRRQLGGMILFGPCVWCSASRMG